MTQNISAAYKFADSLRRGRDRTYACRLIASYQFYGTPQATGPVYPETYGVSNSMANRIEKTIRQYMDCD